MSRKFLSSLLLVLCGVLPAALPSEAEARARHNSQVRLPRNLFLADLDGDGASEFLQVAQNRLFVTRTNYDKTGVLHMYLPRNIVRVLTGAFGAGSKEQVCLVLDDNTMPCYGLSTDGKALWWWFTQGSLLASDEEAIVGDYNGDGQDDVLVYRPSTGALRMLTRNSSGFFAAMPHFDPGNLVASQLVNKQLRAGEFHAGASPRRDDILVYDPGARSVGLFAAVTDGAGRNTFWWWFTTRGGFVNADEEFTVGSVDGDNTDDVALHSSSGAYRFFRAQPTSTSDLTPLTTVRVGQLHTGPSSQLYWSRGSGNRDVALVYAPGDVFVMGSPGSDASGLTYWWAYTQYAPAHNAGWPNKQQHRWIVLMCKFSDQPQEPRDIHFHRRFFTEAGSGSGGMYDYLRDISYGTIDLTGTQVRGWYTMSHTLAQDRALGDSSARAERINRCVRAATDVNVNDYHNVVVLTNALSDSGSDGRRALLDPGAWNVTFAGHEMLHGYGLPHSFGSPDSPSDPDIVYGDAWDIMSAMIVYAYEGPTFSVSGPELNTHYKQRLGWWNANRVVSFTAGARRSTTVTLAAVNKPAANGSLMARVNLPGWFPPYHYTIELRSKSGWDAAIPADAVMVHRIQNDQTTLMRQGQGPDFTAGESFQDIGNGIRVTVNSINTAAGTATVTIDY